MSVLRVILYLVKISCFALVLFVFMLFLVSWINYTIGSYHFNKMIQEMTNSSLVRVTWVHIAHKIIIEDPDILNSCVNTFKSSSKFDPLSIQFDNPGNLVFEYSDGSYFTLKCREKWSPQENKLTFGYNIWWKSGIQEWGWPTRISVCTDYPEKFKEIYESLGSPISQNNDSMVYEQIMFIDTNGNIEYNVTNRIYEPSVFKNPSALLDHQHDFWGTYHYCLGIWAYLLLGIVAILMIVTAKYLLQQCLYLSKRFHLYLSSLFHPT